MILKMIHTVFTFWYQVPYLNIDSESEVFLNLSPNYELKSSYSFNVVASDDLGSNAKSVTLNIEDIDECLLKNTMKIRKYLIFLIRITNSIFFICQ